MKSLKKSNLKEGELLLQQIFIEDEWKFLVCCIFQNLTTGRQIRPMMFDFFNKYPHPSAIVAATHAELEVILKPLGMQKRRAITLKKFSDQYLNTFWKRPIELFGIGKYAQDSYDIFINNDLTVQANDKELLGYLRRKGIDI
jgi:methyl-CpG-binding domain protein 4